MAAKDTLDTGLEEVARLLGEELTKRLKEQLEEKDKSASGTLINTLKSEAKIEGNKAVVQVFAEDYFRFVDQGRSPGRFPPLEPIRQWTRLKGISEDAAFPIARKIAERGIPALNILNPTIEEVTIEFMPKYEDAMEQIIGAVMVNDIFNQTNTKGQIIPKDLRIT